MIVASGYLLDTCIVTAAMRGAPATVLNRLSTIATTRLYLSTLVLGELTAGAEKSPRRDILMAAIRDITTEMPVLPFDADAAAIYGRIRATLENKGSPIGPMDTLIAAQAVAHGLVLVTDNVREFRRVPDLHCDDWMRKPPSPRLG